jgi:hypothetical protein
MGSLLMRCTAILSLETRHNLLTMLDYHRDGLTPEHLHQNKDWDAAYRLTRPGFHLKSID